MMPTVAAPQSPAGQQTLLLVNGPNGPQYMIAEVIGQGLNMPVKSVSQEEAAQYFGWMAMFASLDFPASSALTQAKLDWHPTGPSLIEDLKAMQY